MGLLDSMIKQGISKGISKGISDAVGGAVQKAVVPAAEKLANRAAENINQTSDSIAKSTEELRRSAAQEQQSVAGERVASASLEGALGNLAGAMQSFANEAARNMKICPVCGQPAGADKKFCPACGAALPEETLSQGAVCPKCGKENDIGTRFCADCGEKLPAAAAEEKAQQSRNDAALSRWNELLPQYLKWGFGGSEIELEDCGLDNGRPCYALHVSDTDSRALSEYCRLLAAEGFVQAGQYPSPSRLYKKIDGVVYNFSAEDAFGSGAGYMTFGFGVGEPAGGFDYVKPEPAKQVSLKDLFKKL